MCQTPRVWRSLVRDCFALRFAKPYAEPVLIASLPGICSVSLTWISWPQYTDSQCWWLLALLPLTAGPVPARLVTLFAPLRAQ